METSLTPHTYAEKTTPHIMGVWYGSSAEAVTRARVVVLLFSFAYPIKIEYPFSYDGTFLQEFL